MNIVSLVISLLITEDPCIFSHRSVLLNQTNVGANNNKFYRPTFSSRDTIHDTT